ncbi:MAG: hypothetical protein F6K39_34600 [Okeania sp. SIO3B3]|nr:hypothetical protein [Okeania sp. SIO3B3]
MTNQPETKQAYEAKTKAQIDKLNAQIDELKAKAKQAQADAAINYHEKIEELSTKRDAVKNKFQELQNSSEQAWEDVKVGFESAWNDLHGAFDSAISKFK